MTDSTRVLLVSFHFGPAAATGGFRWSRLVPLLTERGWSFDVLTRDTVPDGHFPPTVSVHTIPIPRWSERMAWMADGWPAWMRRQLRRGTPAAMNGAGPVSQPPASAAITAAGGASSQTRPQAPSLSRRVARALDGLAEETRMLGWALAATAHASELTQRRRYAAVVVSTPPHASHWVGVEISRQTGTPFVPDFRDPWVYGIGDSIRNATFAYRNLGRVLEPRIHEEAALVVRNAELEGQVVGRLYPRYRAKQRAILNGHDLATPPAMPDRARFRLVYTGHLHAWMDPRPFFEACRDTFDARPDIAEVAEIHFMGVPQVFDDRDIRDIAAAAGLAPYFHFRGRGPRAEANALQESAAVLLAYDCTHPLGIPAKFFDYAYMRGEMLLVGHPDGAMAEVATPLGSRVYAPDDRRGIRGSIERAFERWKAGAMTEQNDRDGIYARPVQAAQWDRLLRELGTSRRA